MTMRTTLVRFVVAPVMATLFVAAPVLAQEDGCVTEAGPEALAGRASPLDSISFSVDGQTVKVCYGRPVARGRTMIGGSAVPLGQLWRTGANEPAMIHTPVALSIAGVQVGPGTYSLYTVPGESEWEIIVNRSYAQWGHEGRYTPEVAAQEVGRGNAPVSSPAEYRESFTITHSAGHLVLEWENTQVRVPVSSAS